MWRPIAAFLIITTLLCAPASAQSIVYLNNATPGVGVSDTDTTWWCQISTGCGSTNYMVSEQASQIKTYVQAGLMSQSGANAASGALSSILAAAGTTPQTSLARFTFPTVSDASGQVYSPGNPPPIPSGQPGTVVDVRQAPFNAKCDIIYEASDGSISAASHSLTSAAYTFPVSGAGKHIVVMGAGPGPFYPTTIASYTVNAGGTGYSTNELATMSDGTVLKVITQSGGIVQPGGLAIWSSSGELSLPTQPLTQASTTGGSGSGLQVTLTFYGSPLYTTIASVSGNTATLTAPALNTVRAQYWWYGTDDGAAIQAALNADLPSGTSPGYVNLPGNCGTTQQIEIPSVALSNTIGPTGWIYGVGREISGLYALAPMTAVVDLGTTQAFGGGVANITIEAGGLAQYGLYVRGGHRFIAMHTSIRDASGVSASSDIQIGDGTDAVEETFILNDVSETNFNALAPGQIPLRNIQYAANANDGWVIGTTLAAAQTANLQFIGGTNHAATLHTFGHHPDYAPSEAVILSAAGDTADGVQIDGSTGGAGLSLGAQGTTAINIVCNGFTNEGPPPCVNDAAGTPTNVTVYGVTPVSGQTALAVAGSVVPNLIAIQYGSYIYNPPPLAAILSAAGAAAQTASGLWSFNSGLLLTPVAISALPSCAPGNSGLSMIVNNGVASPTYLGTVSTTGSTVVRVLCNSSAWVYD